MSKLTTVKRIRLAHKLLAAAVIAVGLGTVAVTPALAHDDGWRGERHEWREHEWREHEWREHGWGYRYPAYSYGYVAPRYYAPPPAVVYAPPPPPSFSVVVPLNFR